MKLPSIDLILEIAGRTVLAVNADGCQVGGFWILAKRSSWEARYEAQEVRAFELGQKAGMLAAQPVLDGWHECIERWIGGER